MVPSCPGHTIILCMGDHSWTVDLLPRPRKVPLLFMNSFSYSRAFSPRDQAIFLILATPSGVHISRALALPGRCEKMLNPNPPPPRSGRLNQIFSLTRAPGDSYVPGVWGRLQYISFLPRAYLYFLRGGR